MTTGNDAGTIAGLTKDILSPVGNTLSDAWYGLVGDRVSTWRLKRLMEHQTIINAEATRKGLRLDTARIPDRFAFSWFEEATKQDEPEIQILFARLLLRAASGEADSSDRRLLGILSEMTPSDAAIFRRIYSKQPFPESGHYAEVAAIGTQTDFGPDWPRDWTLSLLEQYHPNAVEKSVEHLVTIGCLRKTYRVDNSNSHAKTPSNRLNRGGSREFSDADWRQMVKSFASVREYFAATSLGQALAEAVDE